MKKRKIRKYDKDFKAKAVELYDNGMTLAAVGKELGIHPDNIRRWSRQLKGANSQNSQGNGKHYLTDDQKKIVFLEKALKEVEIERDILKKTIHIFFKGDSKYMGQ